MTMKQFVWKSPRAKVWILGVPVVIGVGVVMVYIIWVDDVIHVQEETAWL